VEPPDGGRESEGGQEPDGRRESSNDSWLASVRDDSAGCGLAMEAFFFLLSLLLGGRCRATGRTGATWIKVVIIQKKLSSSVEQAEYLLEIRAVSFLHLSGIGERHSSGDHIQRRGGVAGNKMRMGLPLRVVVGFEGGTESIDVSSSFSCLPLLDTWMETPRTR
jgi:hypothetical protein